MNDLTPINRFQSEPEAAWVPFRIAPPLAPSELPRLFSPRPTADVISRANKSDEGYYTNTHPDAQSVHSMSTWDLNQDRQNVQPRRMFALRAQPIPLPPEALSQGCKNDHNTSSADGSSTMGEPTLQSLSEHGSPQRSVTDDPYEVASNCSLSYDEQDVALPAELQRIQAALVEQLISDYISSWRSSHGNIRSRPSQQSTSTSRQARLGTPRSSGRSAPSAKSLGKRRREEDEDADADADADDIPSGDEDRKRRRLSCEVNRLFACPYAKYDPTRYSERNEVETNYRACSSKVLRNISRVKQHLYRVHMRPAQYCPRCGNEFERQDLLEAHFRETTTCDIQELSFQEKMTMEQRDAVHKRTPGKCPRKAWFEIFGILFPNARKPDSPYAETGSPAGVRDFLDYFQERAPQMLSALILQNTLLLGQYEQSMLDAAVEIAVPRLVQEFGSDFHRLPANESQESSDPRPLAEAPTTDPAIPEAVNPNLQQLEAGPADYTGTGSSVASFGHQRFAEQLPGFPEWHHPYPYPTGDGVYSQIPGSNPFTGSPNSNGILQSQMPMPVQVWQPGTWNQSPGQRLQRVAEGA